MKCQVEKEIEILSSFDFQEAWNWFSTYISNNLNLDKELGYQLDHKHWHYPDCVMCIDECKNSSIFIARLYLISQIAIITDYLQDLITNTITYELIYPNNQIDDDLSRVIRSKTTKRNRNSFRDSLSEHLVHWAILASIIKDGVFQKFTMSKPNLQAEDKGLDGLAYILFDGYSVVKIISAKNSINSPQNLISSSKFRNNLDPPFDDKKILDEFYYFHNRLKGFHRVDEKLSMLLQKLHQNPDEQIRQTLLDHHCQYNASVVANEEFLEKELFLGFNRIITDPDRCVGLYLGSKDWRQFADEVQNQVNTILSKSGIIF